LFYCNMAESYNFACNSLTNSMVNMYCDA